MKIGMITIHFAENYGTQLQAFALQKKLELMGHDVEIIDFRPKVFTEEYKILNVRKPKLFLLDMLRYTGRKKQKKLFEEFMENNMNLSKEKYADELNKETFKGQYDVYVSGSDQLWNLPLTNHSMQYFLDFAPDNARKISYAGSLGRKILDENVDKIKNALLRYDKIAVREESAQKEIKERMNIDSEVVVDPVFLLSKKQWEEIAEYDTELKTNDYILIYDLSSTGNKNLMNKAKIEAERLGKKIIAINPLGTKRGQADINLQDVGPKQFLWLIKNAALVCTNSFHGTVFSMIFGTNFTFGFPIHNMVRITDILKKVNIEIDTDVEKHLIPGNNIFRISEEKLELLNAEIKKSENFIEMSLK